MINTKPTFNSEPYKKARPSAPTEIIDYLKSNTITHKKAWDCGTGNGQTAIKLAEFIDDIHATDISKAQLSKAFTNPNIKYFQAPENKSMFENESVDLITSSQAAHWFDIQKFEQECLRILKPKGIVAIWAYHYDITINKQIEIIYQDFLKLIWPYVPIGGNHITNHYRNINLSLTKLSTPQFKLIKQMNLCDFIELLKSFSAYKEYVEKFEECPITKFGFYDKLKKSWGEASKTYNVTWPVIFKCYMKSS
ncbi:class I SAM-dependent methyltransferase [Francisella sp. SYW-9]|uniref:class I SAM-dependent methyltransferase n=1 Tax=Francisella sp. SYW-9 TaxID=2610888 RepID=UPI00123CDB5F|nr:class I SAM-dependent methyltransferase [Francisella sp. SYW-9]